MAQHTIAVPKEFWWEELAPLKAELKANSMKDLFKKLIEQHQKLTKLRGSNYHQKISDKDLNQRVGVLEKDFNIVLWKFEQIINKQKGLNTSHSLKEE